MPPPCRKADFDGVHFADSAVTHEFAGMTEIVLGALLAAGQPYDAVSLDGITNGPALCDIVSKWLLTVNVLAGSGGHDGRDRVPVVRCRYRYRIDIISCDYLAKVVTCQTVPVAVVLVYHVTSVVAALGIDIADGHNLDLWLLQKGAHVAGSLAADTNAAHHDSIARRISPQHRRWNNCRQR